MKYNLKFRIGRLQVSLQTGLVTPVAGVNSNLKDDSHIIMWEFDIPDRDLIVAGLEAIQEDFQLPAIHLAQSHPGGGFHAYCFASMSFIDTLHIVSGTPWVDPNYVTMCAARQHWTLRLTDKGQGQPEHLEQLAGYRSSDAGMEDLVSWVNYTAEKKRGEGDVNNS